MTKKKLKGAGKKPPQPEESPMPSQQMADDGSSRPLGFAASFAQTDPSPSQE